MILIVIFTRHSSPEKVPERRRILFIERNLASFQTNRTTIANDLALFFADEGEEKRLKCFDDKKQ